jgi:hypothetical protein
VQSIEQQSWRKTYSKSNDKRAFGYIAAKTWFAQK